MHALILAALLGQLIPKQPAQVVGGSDKLGNSHAIGVDTFGSLVTRSSQDIFTAVTPITVGNGPRGVTISDLDGDGYQDVLVAERGSANDIRIFWGNGTGTFSNSTIISVGQGVNRCKGADFNVDGILDLACASTGGYVVIVMATGKRTYAAPTLVTISGANVRGIDVAPMGASPCQSIAYADINSANIGVMLGSCDGGFAAPHSYGVSPMSEVYDISAVDMNQDGVADLVIGAFGANVDPFGIMLGNGDGTYAAVYTYNSVPLSLYGDGYMNTPYLAVGDVNNDGNPDVAWTNADGTICVDTQIADTSVGGSHVVFGEPSCIFALNGNFADIVLADINGDHYLDVLASESAYGDSDYVGGQGFVGAINVNGGFLSAGALYTNYTGAPGSFGTAYGPYGIATGDLNGDGIVDVVYSDTLGYNESGQNGLLRVYLGNPQMFVGRGSGATSPQILSYSPTNTSFSPRYCENVAVPASSVGGALDLHPGACLRVSCTAAVNAATGSGLPATSLLPGLDGGTQGNTFPIPAALPQFMCLGNTITTSNAIPETGIGFEGLGTAATCNVCQLNPR